MRTAVSIFVNCGLQFSRYLREQETSKQVRTGEVISLDSLLSYFTGFFVKVNGLRPSEPRWASLTGAIPVLLFYTACVWCVCVAFNIHICSNFQDFPW